jgi:hypothetical protein
VYPAPVPKGSCRILAIALLCPLLGCQPTGGNETSVVPVEPPASWKRVEPGTWRVPGVALSAWSGPEGSSLVVYRTLPVPGGTPEMIAEGLANRMENLPGVRILERRTESVGGATAARVELVAPGTGDALAPSGAGSFVVPDGKTLVPTRQVTLGFLTPDRTIYLRWHVPDGSYDRIAPDIRSTIASVRLAPDGHRPAG